MTPSEQTQEAFLAAKRHREDQLAANGITAAESALLNVIHCGITNAPPDLPGSASGKNYSWGEPVTEEECRVALSACLAKGWLQVVDEQILESITRELREQEVLGPIYGLPSIGGVDFTPAGAKFWGDLWGRGWPFAYLDVVHIRTARYFRSKAAALVEIEKISCDNDSVVSTTLPVAIGPWRVQWWRRYPEGYRIDVEEKQQWQGRCGCGEAAFWLNPPRDAAASPKRLQHILDCHNVTLAEWLVLANVGELEGYYPSDLPCCAARWSAQAFGVTASEEECRRALQGCLANCWLQLIDSTASDEIVAIFERDPVQAPLGFAARRSIGEVDLTSCGAALYQMIAAEYWGPDWDAAISVEKAFYRKEHHYSATVEALPDASLYASNCEHVLAVSDIVPIGPWCVYWWEQFPAGYMREIEIGDRAPGVDTAGY